MGITYQIVSKYKVSIDKNVTIYSYQYKVLHRSVERTFKLEWQHGINDITLLYR